MTNARELEGVAKIKVIGVGGGGSNAVSRMFRERVPGVEYVVMNTDVQALMRSDVPTRIRIGEQLTQGMGVGGDPDKGAASAEESREEIYDIIRDSNMIFVAAGMLTYGIHELESGGVIPYFSGNVDTKLELKKDGFKESKLLATRISGKTKTFNIDQDKKAKKWASRIWDVNPSKNSDGSYPMLHDKGAVGGLLKGFFGYNGDPSLIEFITWLISMIGLNYLYQKIGRKES